MTLAEYLKQGFNNPLTHAGLGIMLGSQAGGQGPLAGFAQGMTGYNQLAAQQADMQDREEMRKLQQAQLSRLKANDDRDAAGRAAIMQAMRANPSMLGEMPLARTVLEATGDPSQLQGLGGILPRQPAPMSDYQKGMLELQGKRLAQQGQTTPYQQAQMDRWQSQQNELSAFQKAQVERWNKENALSQEKEQRNSAAAKQKALISSNDLDHKYQAAMAELDQYDKRLQEFVSMPGASGAYGWTGALAEQHPIGTALLAPGTGDAMARRKELQAQGMLSTLVDLKGAGASLAPISNTDAEALKAKAGNLEAAQSWESAQKAVADIRAQIAATKQRVTQAYQADRSLYEEGDLAKQPERPQTQAEFDALPAGTLFIDPEDGKLYRK